MHEQLIKEIQKTVRDGEVPAKSVAEAVGKPYSTLMREINPYDKGAKLGVETFMAIIETTGRHHASESDGTRTWLRAYPQQVMSASSQGRIEGGKPSR